MDDYRSYFLNKFQKKKIDDGESSFWQSRYSNFSEEKIDQIIDSSGIGSVGKPNFFKNIYHFFIRLQFVILFNNYKSFFKNYNYAKNYSKKVKKVFDLNILRQVFSISFIEEKLNEISLKKNICIIGDGLGSMSLILYQKKNFNKIIIVNLTKSLFLDYIYIEKFLGTKETKERVLLVTDKKQLELVKNENYKIILIEASNYEFIKEFNVDIFINIASMQEMTMEYISNYFQCMRADKLNETFFYCCNRTKKTLPDGSIIEFSKYPWKESDKVISHEICPWYKFYIDKKFPFYHKYHGTIEHKLVRF